MQKPQPTLTLATINERTLFGRSTEVTKTVGWKVNVVVLQEVYYRNKRVKTEFRLYRRNEDKANGGLEALK